MDLLLWNFDGHLLSLLGLAQDLLGRDLDRRRILILDLLCNATLVSERLEFVLLEKDDRFSAACFVN